VTFELSETASEYIHMPQNLDTGVEEAVVMTSRVEESFVSERHGHLSADRSGGGLWSGTPMEQRNCRELGEERHLWREGEGGEKGTYTLYYSISMTYFQYWLHEEVAYKPYI
jgi:hypothetical protein